MAYNSDFDPAAIIRTASRLPDRPKLSGAEIKRRAETLLLRPLSPELLKAYQLTATAGVLALMHYQMLLGIAPRTIRKYTEIGVLERLPDRTPTLRKIRFTESTADLRLYTLGPVGYAMAALAETIAPSGYHAVYDRVTHDFLASHVVIRFVLAAQAYGLKWEWRNRYQAARKYGYKGAIEPDAAIRITTPKTGEHVLFVLELHNEDHKGRGAEKLYRYRGATYNHENLAAWWGIATPTLLVASPYKAPLLGYGLALRDPAQYAYGDGIRPDERAGYLPKIPVYGATLDDLADQRRAELWFNLRAPQRDNLFTGQTVWKAG